MEARTNLMTAAIPGFSEPFSSILHLLAAGLFFVLGVVFLVRNRGTAHRTGAVLIFVIGATFALSMSGVFHLLTPGTAGRAVLQRLDHAAIFFLIAATFTPVHSIEFHGFWRWVPLLFIWSAAIVGITLKSIFFEEIPELLSVTLYLVLGWLGALSSFLLYRRFGVEYILPLLYGALAYTIGAILDFARFPVLIPRVIGPHEIFHVLVVIGVAVHWRFIRRIAGRATAAVSPVAHAKMPVTGAERATARTLISET